jgi:hypothetical protein
MKKHVLFLVLVMFTALLSGCILPKKPSANSFAMPVGDQMTFSVNVYPSTATYEWAWTGRR